MIPLKLSIRNFLSYRENVPTLDLGGVHVACLCGDNGHGKSALLDAITWCLWGRARGQVQDDLVAFGAEEARVELEFLARGVRYRAVRSRRRAGGRRRQGATDLQLQALAFGEDSSQVITSNSVRETQARIEQLVGMDYETFINSAFLLQGRADEFTNKTPAERKAVLSSILGLEAYDRFQSRARDLVGKRRSEADRLDGRLAQVKSELEAIGDPEKELEGVNLALADIGSSLEKARSLAEGLRTRAVYLQGVSQDLETLQSQAIQKRQDLTDLEANRKSIELRIREHREIVSQADEIRKGVARLEAAQQTFAGLEDSRQKNDALRQKANDLGRTIEIEQTRLESETQQLQRRGKEELTPLADLEQSLVSELEDTQNALYESSQAEHVLAELRDRVDALIRGIGEAQSLEAQYRSEGEQISEKLRLLTIADATSPVCPLCQTPLSEDGCQRLSESYEQDIQAKRELYRNNRDKLQQLEKDKENLAAELARQEKAHTERLDQLRTKQARTQGQLEASRSAAAELHRVNGRIEELQALLLGENFAQDARLDLALVLQDMKNLAFDEDSYRRTFQLTRDLEHFNQLNSRLTLSLTQLDNDEEALLQNRQLTSRLEEESQAIQEQIRRGDEAAREKPGVDAQLSRALADISRLDAEQQTALAARGMLEGKAHRRQQLLEDLEKETAALSQAREEFSTYQELVSAFGRQGIQAMLIETVVPRLEEETNLLLGRMTDNRMHVKLETQRERRSGTGDLVETLQINVSDELGSRSYEMYSGGEAFRVNLALRIALSRVLSQRTGAPLPTLFIDEGFGTQDASGRERILDVISAIEDDFDKIIVITHLDDLKDMFPVRIEVQKDANGSTFWLS